MEISRASARAIQRFAATGSGGRAVPRSSGAPKLQGPQPAPARAREATASSRPPAAREADAVHVSDKARALLETIRRAEAPLEPPAERGFSDVVTDDPTDPEGHLGRHLDRTI